jgi:hypothetical protein
MRPLLRRLAVLVPLAVAPVALAQQPVDLIDLTRREQAIAVQQLEAEVRAGMQEAAKLTDKAEAVKRYQALAQRVQDDKNLPDDRRAALKHVLQDRIKLAEVEAATPDAALTKKHVQFAEGSPAKAGNAKAEPPADAGKIKEGIAKVDSLAQQGKQAEAQKAAKELLAKYPDTVSVQILNGISTSAEALAEAQAVRVETDRRRLVAMRDVDRSAMAPVRDFEFPSNWKQLSERRLKAYGMSAEDKAVLESLAAPIKIEFKGTRLQDVIDYLSNQMKRTIILDKNALDEGQLNYDTPVTVSFKTPVATRTALRIMLNNLNLTYVVRDGIIQVTNAARAKDVMVTRSYYIGDLVTGLGMFSSAPQLGQPQDQAQLAANVQVIIEMITQSVDPSSWIGKGGLGVIGYNIQTQSLIIRQSAEVHNLIRGSLNR